VPQGGLLRCRLGLGEDNDDDDPIQSPQLRPRQHEEDLLVAQVLIDNFHALL